MAAKRAKDKDSASEEEKVGAVQKVLDTIYDASVKGNALEKPLVDMANDYTTRYDSKEKAAKAFIKSQVRKCGSVGFATGFGGVTTLPLAIGADLAGVTYLQVRMVAGIAQIGGHDPNSDEVRSLTYLCLTGSAMNDIVKSVGIQVGTKFTENLIGRIPGQLIYAINKKVGFYFLTRFGQKGVVKISGVIPVVGGVIGGGLDVFLTKRIAKNAYKTFIGEDGEEEKEEEKTVDEEKEEKEE